MPMSCSAYGCKSRTGTPGFKEKGISFHQFPFNDKIRLKQWLVNMRRKGFKPLLSSRLCSEHFSEEHFEYQRFTNRRFLKNTAIPTKFCFPTNEPHTKTIPYKLELLKSTDVPTDKPVNSRTTTIPYKLELLKKANPAEFCLTTTKPLAKSRSANKFESKTVQPNTFEIVETILKEDKATQTVDSFTSFLLQEIKRLKTENTELKSALEKFDHLLDMLT